MVCRSEEVLVSEQLTCERRIQLRQQQLTELTWDLQGAQTKMEQAWSGRSQSFGPDLWHVRGVGLEPSGGLRGEPEGWKKRLSGGEGR